MFEREHHVRVAALLEALDGELLKDTNCLFGGGTAIVLTHGEYRESIDVDFIVSDAAGYRELRRRVTTGSGLGALARAGVDLTQARDVRADQYGIRTFVKVGGHLIKLEIVRESRIELEPPTPDDVVCGIATLTRLDMAASKLLANSDRWADGSMLSRVVIDLAMMQLDRKTLSAAIDKADAAYGTIERDLERAVAHLAERPERLEACRRQLKMSIPRAVLLERLKAL